MSPHLQMNKDIQAKFNQYPEHVRLKMEALRALILEVAAQQEVGPLEETLKWGEPAYLTTASKSGTTIRIDWKPRQPDQYALYLNCQTTLVETYRSLFPDLKYDGNRAILFDLDQNLPADELRVCISMALRYHQDKSIPL